MRALKLCPFCASMDHTRIEDCPNIDAEQYAEEMARRKAAKAKRERWTVTSPDGLPIEPRTYASEGAARRALDTWVQRFYGSRVYAAADGRRIHISELAAACVVARKGA